MTQTAPLPFQIGVDCKFTKQAHPPAWSRYRSWNEQNDLFCPFFNI